MSTATQVEQLRARARHLRSVSSMIANSPAVAVYSLAGPDTWVGPTAQACYDALVAVRRQLQTQQQSLSDTARSFERRADKLEQHPLFRQTVS
jgi:alpha-beta hydrolase superfamily lysophospholipase